MVLDLSALAARTSRAAQPIARRYAEGNMIARVKIIRPGKREFDDVVGRDVRTDDITVYEGKARFYPVGGSANYGLGDEPTYFDTTSISIPLSASPVMIDDVATCTMHEDSRMVLRKFRITGYEGGGHIPAVARYSAVGIAPSKQWVGA